MQYNQLLKKHFNVQKGMYFDDVKNEKDYSIFLSKNIQDCFWNYAVIKEGVKNIDDILIIIEKQFFDLQKDSCIYLSGNSNSNILDEILPRGYNEVNSEMWLTYENPKQISISNVVKQVNDKLTRKDFLKVFIEAYGGPSTSDSPYGSLPETYIQSVKRTLIKSKKFIHFVVYDEKNIPVSIASLCIYRNYAGIYNVGTRPAYRKRGFGSTATFACINFSAQKQLKYLLLQTEENSNVEKLYKKLGFKPKFVGKMYVKTNE